MLSVVITNHGYGNVLRRCIDSALMQGCETIVVDDASTDQSRAIMQTYKRRIIPVYHTERSGSPTNGRNEGIERATGDWILFLDADDFLLPRVEENLCCFDADWVTANLVLVDDWGKVIDVWDYAHMPTDKDRAFHYAEERQTLPVSMKGVFRTEWLRDNGLKFRDWPSTKYAEDFITCLDWLKAEPRITHTHRPAVAYRWNDAHESDEATIATMRQDLAAYLRGDI